MSLKITFIGHSTVLLSLNETHILTDPLFVERILVVKRKLPAGLSPQELPPLSAITISHAHTDHMNIPSLKRLPRETRVILPENCAPFLNAKGFMNTTTLAQWEETEAGEAKVTSLPVNHVGGRFFPWQKTGVASYLFHMGDTNVLVAGDVDFGPLDYFDEIASRHRVDVMLLPVGGMREVDYYNKRREKKGVHIDPETAWEIFRRVGAAHLIPIHWGAITIAKTPRDEAPLRLKEIAAGDADCVHILHPGDSWRA